MKITIPRAARWLSLPLAIAASGVQAMPPIQDDYFSGKHGEFQQNSSKVVATYIANRRELHQ